ncbi:putative phosphatase PSR2 [Diplonema papillatum]|nr:putative phosphatase PSR2 [Diplonema papillatum]
MSAAGAKREKVTSYFRKFRENRNDQEATSKSSSSSLPLLKKDKEKDSPSRSKPSSGRGGAADLVTQGQERVQITHQQPVQQPSATGRNFSPVIASQYEPLLPPPFEHHKNRICMVLDLDETLVHSSFRPVQSPDIVLPIDIDGQMYHVYVKKRPFVDEFLRFLEPLFEVVVFTASLSKYADPLLDRLDPGKAIMGPHRLFREHCSHTNGAYVKDLSLLGRPLHKICIIDNSPVAYLFQSHNALPCTSWFEDKSDTELRDFVPMLRDMARSDSVYTLLDEHHRQLAQKKKPEGQ